ncbi:MAG: hypothetical protein ACM3PP_08985 [Candidatus Saccharibacteria bacterium]
MHLKPEYLMVLAVIMAFLIEELLLYLILPMLTNNGAVRKNYRQDDVPVAAGLTFPATVMVCLAAIYLSGAYKETPYNLYLVAIITMSFLGFVDDMLGQRDTLGLKGHFSKLLFEHQLTTGGLKALGGSLVAGYVALFYSKSIPEFILNAVLIGLFTNSMNLFDLRPGRCVKAFLIVFIPLIFTIKTDLLIFIPLLGAVLAYFRYDLRALVMMGDTGSNVLGVTLGIMAVYGLGMWPRLALLAVLVVLHIYTEKYSLTKTIEKYKALNAIDRLGRGD